VSIYRERAPPHLPVSFRGRLSLRLKPAVHPGLEQGDVGRWPRPLRRWWHLLGGDLLVDGAGIIRLAHITVIVERDAHTLHVLNVRLSKKGKNILSERHTAGHERLLSEV